MLNRESPMGQKGKSQRHIEKMKKYREEKKARKELYEKMALRDGNKKPKGSRGAARRLGDHVNGPCGNIGCRKCNPSCPPAPK